MRRRNWGLTTVVALAVGGVVAASIGRAQANPGPRAALSEDLASSNSRGVLLSGGSPAGEAVVGPGALFDAALASAATQDTIIYRVCKDLTVCYVQVAAREPSVVAPAFAVTPPPIQTGLVAVPPAPAVGTAPNLLWGGLGLPFALVGFFLPAREAGEGAGGGGEPPPAGLVPPPLAPDCACPS